MGTSPARAQDTTLPLSRLRRWTGTQYVEIWRSDSAPSRFLSPRDPLLRGSTAPQSVAAGVTVEEIRLGGSGEAFRTTLVVVRMVPRAVRLELDTAFDHGQRNWTIARAPRTAVLAVNAGQFEAHLPWGWVRLRGRDFLAPGRGPLVSAVSVDSAGRLTLVHGGGIAPARAVWGFQSYPTLLAGGAVPAPLLGPGRGIDVAHRDARLAIGTCADGSVVVAMTRFAGLGERLGLLPLGLTTPEMAAVMGLLGATDAVLLDGGISAQLMVQQPTGWRRAWPGLRAVPLALLAYPVSKE